MRNFKIMARGIGNLTDARFFASWEVDWLGFDFEPASPQYIAPEKASAIREWVAGPSIVGSFGVCEPEAVASVCAAADLDAAIVNMFTDPQIIKHLPDRIPLMVEVVADSRMDLTEVRAVIARWNPYISFFIFNFLKNDIHWDDIERGQPLGVSSLRQLCTEYPILLAMDFSPEAIRQAAEEIRPAGFCLQGGDEEKTGLKAFDELEVLLEVLEII